MLKPCLPCRRNKASVVQRSIARKAVRSIDVCTVLYQKIHGIPVAGNRSGMDRLHTSGQKGTPLGKAAGPSNVGQRGATWPESDVAWTSARASSNISRDPARPNLGLAPQLVHLLAANAQNAVRRRGRKVKRRGPIRVALQSVQRHQRPEVWLPCPTAQHASFNGATARRQLSWTDFAPARRAPQWMSPNAWLKDLLPGACNTTEGAWPRAPCRKPEGDAPSPPRFR